MNVELHKACFEVALTTKWAQKPVGAAEIQALSDRFYGIALSQVSVPLEIDLSLISRAVRYLANTHAMPPMDDDTSWFRNMLQAVLEIARPNTGIEEENKQFLRDMRRGIGEALNS